MAPNGERRRWVLRSDGVIDLLVEHPDRTGGWELRSNHRSVFAVPGAGVLFQQMRLLIDAEPIAEAFGIWSRIGDWCVGDRGTPCHFEDHAALEAKFRDLAGRIDAVLGVSPSRRPRAPVDAPLNQAR